MRSIMMGFLSFTLLLTMCLQLLGDEAKKERKTYPEPPKMQIYVNKTYKATIDTSK